MQWWITESLCAALTQDVYVACKGSPENRDVPGDLCSLRAHAAFFFVTLSFPSPLRVLLRTFRPFPLFSHSRIFSVNIVACFYEEQAA